MRSTWAVGLHACICLWAVGCASQVYKPMLLAGPEAGRGTASVAGTASLGATRHAAGRVVEMYPRIPEITEYLSLFDEKPRHDLLEGAQMYGHLFSALAGKYLEPKVMAQRGYFTLGYGHGQFEFRSIRAGEYYVLFRKRTPGLPPWETPLAYTVVKIADGQRLTDVVVSYKPPPKKPESR